MGPSKRKLKKAILAEALALYRDHNFGCRSFTLNLDTGRVVHQELARPYHVLTDLMHLCAQLEGDLP